MKIKVISWNIWHGKYLPDVINFLKSANADIIGLQEVIEVKKDGKKKNQAQKIAKEIGYNYIYYSAFKTDRHETVYNQGNAVLSRFEIENPKCHFLSTLNDYKGNAETEPRIAAQADIKTNGKTLHVFNTHLAYSPAFIDSQSRNAQIDKLINVLTKEKTILAGDFNSAPESNAVKKISKILSNADNNLSEPTWTIYPFKHHDFNENKLKYRIDHIFTSRDIKVIKFNVEKSKASDHLPISAIIQI